jgi:membrane-anchored glycerophosphoryl diester phosphodiesterase (GDPDase)
MTLLGMLLVLVVVGVFIALVPMDSTIRSIIVAIIALVVLFWGLEYFGVLHSMGRWR